MGSGEKCFKCIKDYLLFKLEEIGEIQNAIKGPGWWVSKDGRRHGEPASYTRPAVNVCCAEWLLGGERARGRAAHTESQRAAHVQQEHINQDTAPPGWQKIHNIYITANNSAAFTATCSAILFLVGGRQNRC